MTSDILIKTDNLSAGYENEPVIYDITIDVKHPSFLAIIGPNGAGKSTFMKTMIGLTKVFQGTINVLGYDPTKEPEKIRRIIGYVPQRDKISTNMPIRVKDVVLLGRLARKGLLSLASKKDIRKVKEALEKVNLSHLYNKRFSTLSIGQQQRVLIARALAMSPKILLLDEPLSAVDAPTQKTIIDLLHELVKEGISVVMVTHDINPLSECTDRVILLNKKMYAFGTITDVLNEEVMEAAYGVPVPIVMKKDRCYAIIGDAHA